MVGTYVQQWSSGKNTPGPEIGKKKKKNDFVFDNPRLFPVVSKLVRYFRRRASVSGPRTRPTGLSTTLPSSLFSAVISLVYNSRTHFAVFCFRSPTNRRTVSTKRYHVVFRIPSAAPEQNRPSARASFIPRL